MKQLVCVSKTPETTATIKLTDDGSQLDSSSLKYILNPYDEWYSLVRAIELKEKMGGTVTVINVGQAQNDIVIRKALAIGADDAIRVDAEPTSAGMVAREIAAAAKDGNYDIVYCGKESIDYNSGLVGSMLAELLDLPFVSFVSHMEVEGSQATMHRDIEGGYEKVAVQTPFVLSAAKGLAEQRIPNMKGIMMAKRKPIHVHPASGAANSAVVATYSLPEDKSEVTMIDPENMDELVRLLKEEAKVL